ncbi:MAG: beta-phosphoglucomutase family hydrolase [Nitrosomonadales bacterium]|nr:MAG: beta-phosphoglucomutase family hydrolase [Nitrosomonadales bacterium]
MQDTNYFTEIILNQSVSLITLLSQDYDAFLFDLDGVLTKTARVHAAAWKQLFDPFLERCAKKAGKSFIPFDLSIEYRKYVDGKSRYDGVDSFIRSRNITLPWGSPDDAPGEESICGLGNMKDEYFMAHLKQNGIEIYEGSIALVRSLRKHDIKTAVVSSSNNCAAVLEAAKITDLFDVRVDGLDITHQNLKGKPAPDAFLEAARRLKVNPSRAVVVEDAIVGVEAGRTGKFGYVIGVDRNGHPRPLREAGADEVVADLAQVRIAKEPPSSWSLVFEGYDPANEGLREALCTLGNGYFATRGAAPEAVADDTHYPGTYMVCGYNRLRTDIADRVVENEDLVNFPNWLPLNFRIADGDWFDLGTAEILSYQQELDIRRGVLMRTIKFQDQEGRRSTLSEKRLVSMSDMHLAAQELTLTPENWSGRVLVRSAIDGDIVNAGAKLYRKFNNRHLESVIAATVADDGVFLTVHTNQSNIIVSQAARTQVFLDGKILDIRRHLIEEIKYIGQEFGVNITAGSTLQLEKVVTFYTSRDNAILECGHEARVAIGRAGRFRELLAEHVLAWRSLWRRFDIKIELADDSSLKLNVLMLFRLHMFHLLQTVSIHSIGLDIGVPARGWTGEGYQGHIFWDELFIFPFFNHRVPEITRALLMYRHRRLPEARAAARSANFRGAMFPWQSGSNGSEVTQKYNLNPHSQRWIPDNSHLQRHVGSAIAYNVWQYYQVTRDTEFLDFYGGELILEIALFWSSIASYNVDRGRYEIKGVLGPDEYHDSYPGAGSPGLANNAYTNIMAVWVICRGLDVLGLLSDIRRSELTARLNIRHEEISLWKNISCKMFVPFHDDGIISQFEGYEMLQELDWKHYRTKYGNISRLDLILEAEEDTPNRYKLSKQADVLMLFYLFSAEELTELFLHLDYSFKCEMIPKIIRYYTDRSSHGSTLSRVVHAWVLARSDRVRSMDFFMEALQSDVADIQQGTSAEGVHLGAMAGTVDLLERVTTGIEMQGDMLQLNPQLPEALSRLDMRIRYRGHSLDLKVTRNKISVRSHELFADPIHLCVCGETFEFKGGDAQTYDLK